MKKHILASLLLGFSLLSAASAAAQTVGPMALEQSPNHRSVKVVYLQPQTAEPLSYLGYTRLQKGEGLLVVAAPEQEQIVTGAGGSLFLIPRAAEKNAKPNLNDWDAFIADWSRIEAVDASEPLALAASAGKGGEQIGTQGLLISMVNLSPNDHADGMRQGMDFLATQEEGERYWTPLRPIGLHAGYVANGALEELAPEELTNASYAALPSGALTRLSSRLKDISYRAERRVEVTQNGQYLVVGITQAGELLYGVARVSNIR